MSNRRAIKITIPAVALIATTTLLAGARALRAEPSEPLAEELRSMVESYAQAIETNNRELALWYVHPRSPQKPEIDAALRIQLDSYFERARTSNVEPIRLPDGTVLAAVEQEVVRVVGMKFARGKRRSTYHFREFGGSWRIWEIDEESSP
jgi:hypothetical protein